MFIPELKVYCLNTASPPIRLGGFSLRNMTSSTVWTSHWLYGCQTISKKFFVSFFFYSLFRISSLVFKACAVVFSSFSHKKQQQQQNKLNTCPLKTTTTTTSIFRIRMTACDKWRVVAIGGRLRGGDLTLRDRVGWFQQNKKRRRKSVASFPGPTFWTCTDERESVRSGWYTGWTPSKLELRCSR